MASSARIAATLGLNLFSSLSIVFVNKWLFLYNKFPSITLTLINFIGTSFGLYICLALGLFKRKHVHVRDVLPLAASFCGFVVFTNLSLKYNTVGTYQVCFAHAREFANTSLLLYLVAQSTHLSGDTFSKLPVVRQNSFEVIFEFVNSSDPTLDMLFCPFFPFSAAWR